MKEKDTSQYRYLFHDGRAGRIHQYLGSHVHRCDDGSYLYFFACFAKGAGRVCLASDFTSWSEPPAMTRVTDGGLYEYSHRSDVSLDGQKYKLYIDGEYITDPFCREVEAGDGGASVVRECAYSFSDGAYLEFRTDMYRDNPDGAPVYLIDGKSDIKASAAQIKMLGGTHAVIVPRLVRDTYTAVEPATYRAVELFHKLGVGAVFDVGDIPACHTKEERSLLFSRLDFLVRECHADGLLLSPPRDAGGEALYQEIKAALVESHPDAVVLKKEAPPAISKKYFTADERIRKLLDFAVCGVKRAHASDDSHGDEYMPQYLAALGELYLSSPEMWGCENITNFKTYYDGELLSFCRTSPCGDESLVICNFGEEYRGADVTVSFDGEYKLRFASHIDTHSELDRADGKLVRVSLPPRRCVVYRRVSGNFKCRI